MAAQAKHQARSTRDKERAAMMKRLGIVRKTGQCAQCYRSIAVDGPASRYTHVCR